MENNILFQKDDFIIKRNSIHHYICSFNIENKNIYVDKIIDLNLMKLIYDLNPDIYIKNNIDKKSENEATITCILNNFFEDLGIPQKYSHMHILKVVKENNISFISKTINDFKPDYIPKEAELLAISNMICSCDIESPHKILFTFDIQFDPKRIIPPLPVIKLVGIILNKIFKRVKQFIENLQ